MAGNDRKVRLELLLKSVGVDAAISSLEKLDKKIKTTGKVTGQLTEEQSKLNRNMRGVAQSSNRAGKDQARMMQGMGGLVQAYATIAANVYALSTAFNILKRAADLSSMLKSAEDYSNKYGVSVRRVVEGLQKATGGAFDLAEALPSVNKAISAGISIDKIEKLGIAATKASQTFGGSASEALSRFISAAQRGRTEIIQTLGIVIKTDEVYKEYANTIGKTVLQLTAIDKQQAIVNATIAESEKVLGAVNIDPNPFQQFLVTLTDLKNRILTFVTDTVTPLLKMFNESKEVALIFIFFIINAISKKLMPVLDDMAKKSKTMAIEMSASASQSIRAIKAQQAALARLKILRTEKINPADAQRRVSAFNQELQLRQQINKHASMTVIADNASTEQRVAMLGTQKAALQQAITYYEKHGKMSAKWEGLTITQLKEQLLLRQAILAELVVTPAIQKKNQLQSRQEITEEQLAARTRTLKMKIFTAEVNRAKFALKGAFMSGKSAATTSFTLGIAQAARHWRIFVKQIQRGAALSKIAIFGMTAAMRTFGVVAGIVGVIVNKAFGWISWILTAVYIFKELYEWITGLTKEIKKLNEVSNTYLETMTDSSSRMKKFTQDIEKAQKVTGKLNFKETTEAFQFLIGSMDEFITARAKLENEVDINTGGFGIRGMELERKRLEDLKAATMQKRDTKLNEILPSRIKRTDPTVVYNPNRLEEARAEYSKLNAEVLELENQIRAIPDIAASDMGPALQEGIEATLLYASGVNKAMKALGFDKMGGEMLKSFEAATESLPSRITPELRKKLIDTVKVGGDIPLVLGKLELDENELGDFWARLGIFRDEAEKKSEIAVSVKAAQDAFKGVETEVKKWRDGFQVALIGKIPEKELLGFYTQLDNARKNYLASAEKGGDLLTLGQAFADLPEALKNVAAMMQFDMSKPISEFFAAIEQGSEEVRARALAQIALIQQQKILTIQLKNVSSDFARTYIAEEQKAVNIGQKKIQLAKNAMEQAEKARDAALKEELTMKSGEEGYEFANRALEYKKQLTEEEYQAAKKAKTIADEMYGEEATRRKESLRIVSEVMTVEKNIATERERGIKAASYFAQTGNLNARISALREEQNIRNAITEMEYTLLAIQIKSQIENTNNLQLKAQLLRQLKEIERSHENIRAQQEDQNALAEITLINTENTAAAMHRINMNKLAQEAADFALSTKIITGNWKKTAQMQADVLDIQKRGRYLNIEQLKLQRAQLIDQRLSTEEYQNQYELSTLKIKNLEIQNIELDYQAKLLKELNNAEANEPTLGGIFTPGNFKLMAKSFRNEMNKAFRDLEPALLTFTKGLVSTVGDTVDAVIDSVMENGFSKFGRTLGQSLREGITQALGDTLKNNIKRILTATFNEYKGEAEKAKDAQIAESMQKYLETGKTESGATATSAAEAAKNLELINTRTRESMLEKLVSINTTLGAGINVLNFPACCGSAVEEAGPLQLPKMAISSPAVDTSFNAAYGQTNDTVGPPSPNNDPIKAADKNTDKTIGALGEVATGVATSGVGIMDMIKQMGIQQIAAIIQAAIMQMIGSSMSFAQGGVTGVLSNRTPIKGYAQGAITRGPELAVIGEGKNREAIVPLPNNRSIPVDLRGSQEASSTVNIEQNFDFTNADANSIGKLRAEARAIEERTFNKVFTEINKGGRYAKISGRR